jgi:hypothetical protein
MSPKKHHSPTKRDLLIWRSVRIDNQRRLDVAVEFQVSMLKVNRTVAFVDKLQANRGNEAPFDAQNELRELLRMTKRAFRLSQLDDTIKVKRGGDKGSEPVSNIAQSPKIVKLERVRRKNGGNPHFLRLAYDIARTLQPGQNADPNKVKRIDPSKVAQLNRQAIEQLPTDMLQGIMRITQTRTVAELVPTAGETSQRVLDVVPSTTEPLQTVEPSTREQQAPDIVSSDS